MDRDPSPEPHSGDDIDGDPSRPEGREDTSDPSLLGRLFGWSANGTGNDDVDDAEPQLGAAFANSSPAELLMVSNILRLRDLRVEDVMTPRADIVAVEEGSTLQDVVEASENGSHSRLPVYRETLDDPIGFVHLRDLALSWGFGRSGNGKEFRLTDYLRIAIFVPPSMRIASLLQKMQGERVHMALVIDEFGGVDGLITIEDLVEQIVGDIEDEHDREDSAGWVEEADGNWLVQARADVREFQQQKDLDLLLEEWEEDVDTMGGLVFMLANRVPARGEVILHPNGYEFEIVDADLRRIKRLRLRMGNARPALSQAAE